MDLRNPFETFKESAFRLEALPQYVVEEEKEPLKHFQKTGLIQISDQSWPDLIRKNIESGKKMERLRLLSDKLTDYERYELQAYSGPSAGEEIHLALRSDYNDHYRYDFWFFDNEWIAQVNYKDDGTFINFDVRIATNEEKEMFTYWYSVFQNSQLLRQATWADPGNEAKELDAIRLRN
jgi:hypothetical protein